MIRRMYQRVGVWRLVWMRNVPAGPVTRCGRDPNWIVCSAVQLPALLIPAGPQSGQLYVRRCTPSVSS